MALLPASLTVLLLSLSGLQAVVVTQEKSISVNLGDNVKIACSIDNGWTVSWYQQKPGSGPAFLLYTSDRADRLPSRFTYSGSSGSTQYLHINGLQAEDLAVYHCAGVGGSSGSYFGGGTELVLDQPASPPSLDLLAPAQAPLSGDSATLVCLARGFYPDSASVSWSEDGASLTGTEVQTGQSHRQPDGTYTLSSLLSLPSARWLSGHTFTCKLSHSALTSPLSKSVSNTQCAV